MTKKRAKITNAFRAVNAMRAGGVLMKMHTCAGSCWYIVPYGEVTAVVATELLERPDVQPGGDGLFPGIPQTYRLVAAPLRPRRNQYGPSILSRRYEPSA
jgi:hypothetical protein